MADFFWGGWDYTPPILSPVGGLIHQTQNQKDLISKEGLINQTPYEMDFDAESQTNVWENHSLF